MTNLIDQYLLFRLRIRRDKEAFAKFYDRYVQAIYRFVFLKLPSREMAEDVTAETFLRCWQFIQRDKEIGNIRALLYKIARNLVVDTYRQKDRMSLPLSEWSSVTFASSETSEMMQVDRDVSDRSQAAAQIEARADLQLIMERIARLKEDYRDVLTLRLIDGLPFGDIAKILDKTAGNVRVIYHRAMKALDHFDDYEHA